MSELRGDDEIQPGAQRRLVVSALFFALGVTTIFGLLGLGATAAGQAFRMWKEELSYLAAAVIFVFGLHFLGILRIPFLMREARMESKSDPSTVAGWAGGHWVSYEDSNGNEADFGGRPFRLKKGFIDDARAHGLPDSLRDLRKALPRFSADALIGSNMDGFHKDAAHQRRMLDRMTSSVSSEIEVAGLTMKVIASPVLDADGERLGTVVEWANRTAEVAAERHILVMSARTAGFLP